MPRMTSIQTPDGELMALRWGRWHTEMMLAAAGATLNPNPDGPYYMDHDRDVSWPYTMPHDFSVCDIEDHEELTLPEGSILSMWFGR